MHAAHAPIVSAIRADYHMSANARTNQNEAVVAADRPIRSTCHCEDAAVADNDDEFVERTIRMDATEVAEVYQDCLGQHVGCRANLAADRIAEEASKRWLDWQCGRGRAAEHQAVDRAECRLD